MVQRLSRPELYMGIAKLVALRSTCDKRRVGAVLVRKGRIVSIGYNGSPSGMPHCTDVGCKLDKQGHCISTIHAEANLIAFAAREGIATEGGQVYITLEPCLSCAKLLINAGVKEVYYFHPYTEHDGIWLLHEAKIKVEEFSC